MPRVSDVIVSSQRPAQTRLSVPRRGRLLGTVIDLTSDALLEGLDVRLWDAQGATVAEASTDVDGCFRFADLRPGTYRLDPVLPRGYAVRGDLPPIHVTPGADLEVDIELELIGRVEGTVVDEDTGDPIPEAVVRLFDSQDRLVAETRTDEAGRYVFMGLAEDKFRVEIVPA